MFVNIVLPPLCSVNSCSRTLAHHQTVPYKSVNQASIMSRHYKCHNVVFTEKWGIILKACKTWSVVWHVVPCWRGWRGLLSLGQLGRHVKFGGKLGKVPRARNTVIRTTFGGKCPEKWRTRREIWKQSGGKWQAAPCVEDAMPPPPPPPPPPPFFLQL